MFGNGFVPEAAFVEEEYHTIPVPVTLMLPMVLLFNYFKLFFLLLYSIGPFPVISLNLQKKGLYDK